MRGHGSTWPVGRRDPFSISAVRRAHDRIGDEGVAGASVGGRMHGCGDPRGRDAGRARRAKPERRLGDCRRCAGHVGNPEPRSPRSERRPSSGREGGDWFSGSQDARSFHRRLPLGYLRSDDALPGRRQIEGGCCEVGRELAQTGKGPQNTCRRAASQRGSSRRGASLWSGPAELDLSGVPSLDFGSQPKARSTTTKIEDRPRHVRITMDIETDGVPVSEAEDPGDVVRVD